MLVTRLSEHAQDEQPEQDREPDKQQQLQEDGGCQSEQDQRQDRDPQQRAGEDRAKREQAEQGGQHGDTDDEGWFPYDAGPGEVSLLPRPVTSSPPTMPAVISASA